MVVITNKLFVSSQMDLINEPINQNYIPFFKATILWWKKLLKPDIINKSSLSVCAS